MFQFSDYPLKPAPTTSASQLEKNQKKGGKGNFPQGRSPLMKSPLLSPQIPIPRMLRVQNILLIQAALKISSPLAPSNWRECFCKALSHSFFFSPSECFTLQTPKWRKKRKKKKQIKLNWWRIAAGKLIDREYIWVNVSAPQKWETKAWVKCIRCIFSPHSELKQIRGLTLWLAPLRVAKEPGENPGRHGGETPLEFNRRFFAHFYCPSREICAELSSALLSHNCMHTFMDEKVRWDGDKTMRN